ncbi:MAG: hypothetical protein ABF272_00465, partial [Flavobacteriales bacterium]
MNKSKRSISFLKESGNLSFSLPQKEENCNNCYLQAFKRKLHLNKKNMTHTISTDWKSEMTYEVETVGGK